MKVEITVTDSEAIMSTPMGGNMYSNSIVITKEAFIECYERWVKPIERKDEVKDGSEWIVEANSLGDLVEGLWVGGKRLVRCKDCKYHEDEEVGMVYCPNIVGGWVREDFYCGDGERKDEVEE